MGFSTNYENVNDDYGILPEGDYEVIIRNIEERTTKKGSTGLNLSLVVRNDIEQKFKDRYIFYTLWKKKEPTDAERKMLCVFKEYYQPENSDFPMTCLTFSYRKENKLTHRDFLGAIMALQIKRETVGDIVIGDGTAQIAVSDSVGNVII